MVVAMMGMGAMGSRMAQRVIAAGHTVRIFNRTPRELPGAETVATPRAAAAGADVVISMLTDIEASRAVWQGPEQGALGGLKPGAVAVEASTLTPEATRALGEAVTATGARFLEAPVVGTRPHADQGALTVLVGGEAAALATAQPVFEAFGKVVHVGPVGQAMALKLAINSLFAGQVVLLSEVLALLVRHDVPVDRGLSLLEPTPVFAPVLGGIAALMRADDDAPRFPVALVEKDLAYAAGQGALPLLDAVRGRYAAATAAELGERNIQAVAKLVLDPDA